MPQTITFTGARILSASYTKDGVSIKMAAKLTDRICEQMGWTQELDEGTRNARRVVGFAQFLTGAKPEGKLAGTVLELTPSDKEMAKHQIALDISSVDGFEVVRREQEGTRGKANVQEVHFHVAVKGTARLRKIEGYCEAVGIGKLAGTSRATVSYEKQAELPMANAEAQKEIADAIPAN